MKLVRVQLPPGDGHSYTVRIQPGLLDQLGRELARLTAARSAVIISDSNVGALYGQRAARALAAAGIRAEMLTFPAGEENKHVQTCVRLWDGLARMTVERATPVVALGGGVAGDVAGFVAACYLRGLPVVQVPTTLLACVDSSVGGKTGVDHAQGGKNAIGAFHQPIGTLIDPLLLSSLPGREWSCGLAESVKHGLALDAKFLALLERRADDLAALVRSPAKQTGEQAAMVGDLIAANCRIKAAVVMADEREAGLRAVLNLGHTVGHAVEALSGFGRLRHGEAVSIGMVVATRLAVGRALVEPSLLDRVVALLSRMALPTAVPGSLTAERVVAMTMKDKKVRGGKVRVVLPVGPGHTTIVDDIATGELSAAIEASRAL
jgi:3-dehydroquinate synthase